MGMAFFDAEYLTPRASWGLHADSQLIGRIYSPKAAYWFRTCPDGPVGDATTELVDDPPKVTAARIPKLPATLAPNESITAKVPPLSLDT